jgi:dUTP pyrophosphatase
MKEIKIRYLSDKIEKLRYIDGKSDWIDLRAAEKVELKAGECVFIPADTGSIIVSGNAVLLESRV